MERNDPKVIRDTQTTDKNEELKCREVKIPSEVLHASTTIVERIRRVISKFEASKCRKKVPKCRKKCSDMIFAVMVRQNK